MSLQAARAVLILACACALSSARADDGAPAPQSPAPLTLEQSVAQALARNFTVRIQAYPLDQAKAGVIIAQSTYDPVLGVSWQEMSARTPNLAANGPSTSLYPYAGSQTTTVSASQNVITGGQVSASYAVVKGTTSPVATYINPAYTGNVSLNVSQPLLQGAGTDYARAAIEIARTNERIAGLNFKSVVLTMIYNVETAYYNLIFARQQHEVAKDTLRLAQQLLDENNIKRRTGVLTDLDVVQAEAGVATANSQLIGYRQAMENAEDLLLQTMGERAFRGVGPVEFPPLPDTGGVNFARSYKLARDNGPSLAIVQATIDQYKLQALRTRRNGLPQLTLTGGAGYNTLKGSFGAAAGDSWNGPGYNWDAGLALSFPWGLRSNRALYRQALDSVESEQVAFDQADQALMVQVRAAVRAVATNVEGVAASAKASTLSQRQYELQKARFDAGLATSYDVLLAQNQLETARVAELQARVNLRVAIADLRMLEGASLGNYRVNLRF
jgi:outer membrane protein